MQLFCFVGSVEAVIISIESTSFGKTNVRQMQAGPTQPSDILYLPLKPEA